MTYCEPYFYAYEPTPELELALYYFSTAGLPDVPGYSIGAEVQNHRTVSIGFNRSFNWNDDGIMDQSSRRTDVWTVAVHELGHASGLAHPYPHVCGSSHPTLAEAASVMYVDWTAKRYPNSDDKAGIAARY